MLGALDGAAASEAAGFLASMQRAEGGFAACTGAPAADLLSTFTALVALDGLGALHMVKLAPAARFVQSLEEEAADFGAAAATMRRTWSTPITASGRWGFSDGRLHMRITQIARIERKKQPIRRLF